MTASITSHGDPSPDEAAGPGSGAAVRRATVDIVLPVYNEERELAPCVEVLRDYLSESFPLTWRITIVDNASTDGTWPKARELERTLHGVHALHLPRKGRGLALRTSWARSTADIVAYMDVDLSTGLDALLPLIAPLASGHSDVAIGSRLARGARTVRGTKREVISRCYNALLRGAFGARFRDAQCGFKAMRTDVARALLPEVHDDAWFFDTELLLLAQHNGLRIHEVPVDWVEDTDSRVEVVSTAWHDLRGLAGVARRIARGRALVPLPRRPGPRPVNPQARTASCRQGVPWEMVCRGTSR